MIIYTVIVTADESIEQMHPYSTEELAAEKYEQLARSEFEFRERGPGEPFEEYREAFWNHWDNYIAKHNNGFDLKYVDATAVI